MEIKQPLNIHSNVSFILIMIGGLILCPVIAYVLWRIYRVRSNMRGVKPIVKIFNEYTFKCFFHFDNDRGAYLMSSNSICFVVNL